MHKEHCWRAAQRWQYCWLCVALAQRFTEFSAMSLMRIMNALKAQFEDCKSAMYAVKRWWCIYCNDIPSFTKRSPAEFSCDLTVLWKSVQRQGQCILGFLHYHLTTLCQRLSVSDSSKTVDMQYKCVHSPLQFIRSGKRARSVYI